MLCIELAEPMKSADARHEGIFAAAGDDKIRNALEAPADRFPRNRKVTAFAIGADDGILIAGASKEHAVVYPFGLNKLKLPADICTDKCEHQTAILAVVFELTIGKNRAVRGSATDH